MSRPGKTIGIILAAAGLLPRSRLHQLSLRRADFDLSALLLDAEFRDAGHVSWPNYHDGGVVYSGDLTQAPAPDGATEFIDLPLQSADATSVA